MTAGVAPSPGSGHYFDHAATSLLLPEARNAMLEAMNLSVSGAIGNASSLHGPGHRASEIIESARASIARLINANPSEIIFTSGGSESNNTVMHIFAGQQIVTSAIEHPSVLEAAKAYRGDGKQKLYSCMLANNEIGNIFPVKELAAQAHAEAAYFHTDATQALGKIPVDVRALGVDYLTASAHKIGGPVGIGILYVKSGAPFIPLILGGHQEKSRRAGTSQVINAAGFGAAADYAIAHRTWELYEQKIRPLRDELERRILAEIPYSATNSNFGDSVSLLASRFSEPHKDGREEKQVEKIRWLPNIVNVSFAAAEGESIQLYLDLEGGIQVSTGSACASGDGKPSHVLMALTHDAEIAHSSIRFSLGLDTTKRDINHAIEALKLIIARLQSISTIKIGESK